MKTLPFIFRVLCSVVLGFVPAADFENLILSSRFGFKSGSENISEIVLLEFENRELESPVDLIRIKAALREVGVQAYAVAHAYPRRSESFGIQVDPDGVVRRYLLDQSEISIPELVIRGGAPTNLQSGGIHFKNPRSIKRFKFTHSQLPELKDKIVLLTQLPESSPIYSTPIGEQSGVELSAQVIHTVLYEPLKQVPLLLMILYVLALGLLSAVIVTRFPVLVSFATLAGLCTSLLVVFHQLAFHFLDLWIPSAPVIFTLLSSYLIFTGFRIATQSSALKAIQTAQEMEALKQNFLSLLSHDLKTPLAKIQALTEKLRRESPTVIQSDLTEIEHANYELRTQISSILELSRVESQNISPNKRPTDINRLVEQCAKRLKSVADRKKVTFSFEAEPLFSIEIDPDLMAQVITNLIDNAIRFSPEGGKILLKTQEDSQIHIEISDEGPGIPEEEMPLLFKKMSRYTSGGRPRQRGTGLGLYLSKVFVEEHGGLLRFERTDGRSCFRISLPVSGIHDSASAQDATL